MSNLICPWPSPTYFIFADHVPPLLYYAYLPILLLVIFFGLLIFVKDNFSLQGKLLFVVSLCFAAWIVNTLVQWTSNEVVTQMFAWQLTALFEFPIYLFTIYFAYSFLDKNDISFRKKILFLIASLPIFLFLPTSHDILSFYLTSDDCGGYSGYLWDYIYSFEAASIVWIVCICIDRYRKLKAKENRVKAILLMLGITLFFSLFFLSNIIGEVTQSYEINLIGPLGMLLFIVLLTIMTVRYRAFNIKMVAAQALVATLWILVFAILFIQKITSVRIVVGVTLILISIIGYILIRNVKKERKQLETIERLANDLETSNRKLRELDRQKSEFVSIASHQLRGPLTAIKGYASLVIEGDMGAVTDPVKESVERIFKSAQSLVGIVGDFLDVSRIEQGRMKYEFVNFDLKDLVESTVHEFEPAVKDRGLTITFSAQPNAKYTVFGDSNKLKQVFNNFIDNAIKYTPQGTIAVTMEHTAKGTILTRIKDSGIGMTQATMDKLFEKFSRADDASQTNVIGTGLGLFVAKEMMKAHKGNVWAESEGKGKGSTFCVEINAI